MLFCMILPEKLCDITPSSRKTYFLSILARRRL